MPLDVLIFAAIAAFLVYRLKSVLGTRHGEERDRPNPFAEPPRTAHRPIGPIIDAESKIFTPRVLVPENYSDIIDAEKNKDGRIDTGLSEIAAADAGFDPLSFMKGARAAFEMVVTAYAAGDRDTLKKLLSPGLYADFNAGISIRETAGQVMQVEIHRIKQARIIEAHLGGTMAYLTVDFDVEETMATKDKDGKVVEGNPDNIFNVEDIWTFSRDVRSSDPNWTLIETRTVEK